MLSHAADVTGVSLLLPGDDASGLQQATQVWALRTKYYEARVRFWFCCADAHSAVDLAARRWDGVVCVFDPHAAHPSAAPAFWASHWIPKLAEAVPESALGLVVSHVGGPDELMPEPVAEQWADWCLEHTME